jgi:1-acyl-sn-glycerol-3-phosphate acyltransferase
MRSLSGPKGCVSRQEYRVSWGLGLRRAALTAVVRLLFHIGGRVKLAGRENIPLGTPYVAAANHVSIYDPPLVLSFWPEGLEAIGAVDVFDKPIQGQLLRIYGTTRVHRGDVDRKLIETILAMLHSGHRVLIAPEGSRSHVPGMLRAKTGVGYILAEAGVPVVPIGVVGTTDDLLKKALRLRRPTLELRVGRPFMLPPLTGSGAERRLSRQRNADLVMHHIAALLPAEYRGVYADSASNPT